VGQEEIAPTSTAPQTTAVGAPQSTYDNLAYFPGLKTAPPPPERDPLDVPIYYEPPAPDPATQFAARLDEAIEALMRDRRINLEADAQHLVNTLYALSDGRERFAATYKTLSMRVPNYAARTKCARKEYVKRGRRHLEQSQANAGILLVEIIPGGIRKREDEGEPIRIPTEYIMHITRLAREVLDLLSADALNSTSPSHIDREILDNRNELTASTHVITASARASWRTSLFRRAASAVLDKYIEEGSVELPVYKTLPLETNILKNLRTIKTLAQNTFADLEKYDLGLNLPEHEEELTSIRRVLGLLESRRGYVGAQNRKKPQNR
jgi:hypothetical protein